MKGVENAMGPVADENLKLAPGYFVCQVDICGPFKMCSPANEQVTLKIWFIVFVCTVTSAVDCCVMECYDTESFLLFSCLLWYRLPNGSDV